ncbi:MAG: hypothetical protein ACI9TV_000395 [Sulfurimonas sp.]|jgi:hypothetical protein|uniref:hypothetical protein n=1 Tax=Sulfurimonas sp. TaxID=2022749 RepID=UPI0039E3CBB6
MKAISINISNKDIQELDIEIKPDTVYSFFNSILIDEIETLTKHTIHTDANALSELKTAFFIGEQLVIGNALITGKSDEGEKATTIPLKELEEIISYNVSKFYLDTLSLLSATDINIYRPFFVSKDTENIPLSTEWVLYTFNIADERTKKYFLNELEKSLSSTKETEVFIQKMAGLALNAA